MTKFYRFVMLMALFLAVGMTSKVDAAKVYLNAPSPYTQGNETWYAFNWDGDDIDNGTWASGTATSDGLLMFNVAGEKVSFKRSSGAASHDAVWNMSEDLSVVDNGIYTVSGWGSGQLVNGYWSTVVYLSPGDYGYNNWYAWAWTGEGSGSWYSGTVSEGKVKFFVPVSCDKIIFAKMNDNSADWNNINNNYRTNDLNIIKNGTYTITGFGDNRLKGTWDQTDSGTPILIPSSRKALTGRHCMVNKMISVVDVASWASGIDNMVDEDLDNYATFPSVATVGVGVNPVTSIRDTKNHYAAGTRGGFLMVANSESSLLTLDVIKTFAVSFYLEGELQGTKAVDQNSTDVLNLSLITIPGSNDPCLELSAVSDWEFDEIALMPAGGVNADVVSSAMLRYAFVGDIDKNTVTYSSMNAYASEHGRRAFTLDQNGLSTHMIDDDLDNSTLLSALVSFGGVQIQAQFDREDPDQSQCFKKGSTVGFNFATGSVLSLDVAKTLTIKLYKGEWVKNSLGNWKFELTEVQSTTVNGTVANLGLITGGREDVNIVATEDFSAMALISSGLLNVGGAVGYYAYVSDPAEVNHHCDLNLSSNAAVCSKDTEYQLTSNPDIPVTWSIESQPSGANASIDVNGKLTMPKDVDGEYVIKATAADGCSDYVTITHGLDLSSASCDNPIVNSGETAAYELTQSVPDSEGALININGNLQDPENVLNQSLEDYAMYNSVLNATVVENLPIVGVKKTDGLISDGSNAHRIGFIVEAKSTGLTADVIDLFNIRTYNNGVQTASKVIKETNAIKVKLIGSERTQKMRFSVDIPAGVQFNEFVLWKSGVLDLSLDRVKIYYAFDEAIADEDEPTECYDPLGCASTLISSTTNARIDGNNSQFAGAINAAVVVDNLTFLVDDDINTGISLSKTVSLGNGIVLAVDLGHVYPANQQVGLIMDSKTYLAGVKAGSWITMKTYLNGVEQESKSDWSVLGVNAIGYGDKSYIFINPTKPYDAIRITIADIAELLTFDSKYYGIFVRNDYDQDGTPDCKDDDSCYEEYTLDEEATTLAKSQDYPDGSLVLHRSFDLGEWNCITLPVDLTWEQVRNAFGNKVQIAVPKGFYYTSWIGEDAQGNPIDNHYKLTMLYYEPCQDDGLIAMEKNKYYIIKPYRDADLITGTYAAKDGNTVNAPVYFIPKVTYLRESEMAGGAIDPMTVSHIQISPPETQSSIRPREETIPTEENGDIKLRGSQVYLDGQTNSNVAQNNYLYTIDNNLPEGKRSSLQRVTSDNGAPMLGFRFYAENNTPWEMQNDEGYDVPTSIMTIFNDIVKPMGVYTLDGRLVRTNNSTFGLPVGIYIVGGKKVVITNR